MMLPYARVARMRTRHDVRAPWMRRFDTLLVALVAWNCLLACLVTGAAWVRIVPPNCMTGAVVTLALAGLSWLAYRAPWRCERERLAKLDARNASLRRARAARGVELDVLVDADAPRGDVP